MAKMMTIHGLISGIFLYAQLKEGIPYLNYYIDTNATSQVVELDKLINPKEPLLFHVHFNNVKSFVDQMTFNKGTHMGFLMKQVYQSLELREV